MSIRPINQPLQHRTPVVVTHDEVRLRGRDGWCGDDVRGRARAGQDRQDRGGRRRRTARWRASSGRTRTPVATFMWHYFRHVDPADLEDRTVDDLLALVESHYRAALVREPGQDVVRVVGPGGEPRADLDAHDAARPGGPGGSAERRCCRSSPTTCPSSSTR